MALGCHVNYFMQIASKRWLLYIPSLLIENKTKKAMTDIEAILKNTRSIAIVGLSDNPARASYGVAQYLMPYYKVIPVNPKHKQILGLTCYPDLESIPEPVDMVDVFQRSENVMPLIGPAIAIGASCFWMQLDIRNFQARQALERAGIEVVEDKCTKIEHARYA